MWDQLGLGICSSQTVQPKAKSCREIGVFLEFTIKKHNYPRVDRPLWFSISRVQFKDLLLKISGGFGGGKPGQGSCSPALFPQQRAAWHPAGWSRRELMPHFPLLALPRPCPRNPGQTAQPCPPVPRWRCSSSSTGFSFLLEKFIIRYSRAFLAGFSHLLVPSVAPINAHF